MIVLNPLVNFMLLKMGQLDSMCSLYDVTGRTKHQLCAKRTKPESNWDS